MRWTLCLVFRLKFQFHCRWLLKLYRTVFTAPFLFRPFLVTRPLHRPSPVIKSREAIIIIISINVICVQYDREILSNRLHFYWMISSVWNGREFKTASKIIANRTRRATGKGTFSWRKRIHQSKPFYATCFPANIRTHTFARMHTPHTYNNKYLLCSLLPSNQIISMECSMFMYEPFRLNRRVWERYAGETMKGSNKSYTYYELAVNYFIKTRAHVVRT